VSSRLPTISPTHPTLVREPFHRDGWVYEEKYDGWRILAYKEGEHVRLVSRNGREHTSARSPQDPLPDLRGLDRALLGR
jgi:ATP-dependent DNA ligase